MEEKEKIVFDVRIFFSAVFFPSLPYQKKRSEKISQANEKKKGGGEGEKKGYSEYQRGG